MRLSLRTRLFGKLGLAPWTAAAVAISSAVAPAAALPVSLAPAAVPNPAASFVTLQGPKSLEAAPYKNTRWGFQVNMFTKWTAVPPQPTDPFEVAKFATPQPINHKSGAYLHDISILRFDPEGKSSSTLERGKGEGPTTGGGEGSEPPKEDDKPKKPELTEDDLRKLSQQLRDKSFTEYLESNYKPVEKVKVSKRKFGKLDATVHEFKVKSGIAGTNICYYSVVFMAPDKSEVVLNYSMPDFKFDEWKDLFIQSASSFKFIGVTSNESTIAAAKSMLDADRLRHKEDVEQTPGWALLETKHYFIKHDVTDQGFLKDLQERIEAIYGVYEKRFLGDKKLQAIAEKAAQAEDASYKKGGAGKNTKPVLRVVKDEKEYYQYGGPGGSAGYFSPGSGELVVPCFKSVNLVLTWAVLNHEAFHQFIHHFFGELSPHSWFNEGTGDYYAGWRYQPNGKFDIKPLSGWAEGLDRLSLIREWVRDSKYVPFEEFLRYTQQQYYSGSGVHHYSQGWSIIYFFLRGKEQGVRPWKPEWDRFLSDYLEKLMETKDLTQAIDYATRDLQGAKMKELEEAWKRFVGDIK